jgi:hypothetical protein
VKELDLLSRRSFYASAILALVVAPGLACSSSDAGPALRATGGSGGSAASVGGSVNAGTGGTGTAGTNAGGSPAVAGAGGTSVVAGGAGGSGGSGGAADGTSGGAGGSAPAACPANAFFCSGFEDAGLPTGATYLSNVSTDYTSGSALDKTIHHGGAQSIEILKSMSYSQREIVVPAATTFWFRVYLQTDVMIGGPDGANHNTFLEAAYPGGDKGVEVVEEDCELGMNINDSRYGSNNMVNQPGCPATPATQLAANTWQCIEGYFDGTTGDFRLFANGKEVITQMGVAGAKQPFNTLRFGYREYHPHDRNVWYDDVVTAPTQIGCH